MQRFSILLLGFLTALGPLAPSFGQGRQFRGSQAHFGVGFGLFTYHGRVDLTQPKSRSNFTRQSDPAAVVIASFPIVRDRLFFRGMAGLTNFEARTNQEPSATNEFTSHELFWFEPQVVLTPLPGSTSLFLPYVYTGFGSLVADPFGPGSDRLDVPGSGAPGPDRSVFTLPIGLGVDYAVSDRFSFFVDASFRFNFNYVVRNEQRRNPHNTSLVMLGFRFNFNPVRRIAQEAPPAYLPPPLEVPPYEPPRPEDEPPPDQCVLAALNTVYFDSDSTELSAEQRLLLDENVEALELNPACCAEIIGYTDSEEVTEAIRISRERARFVYRYYIDHGISADRLAIRARGTALSPCNNKDGNCGINRRVESVMVTCSLFPR